MGAMIRTTVTIDEQLLATAKELTGCKKTTALIDAALNDLVAKYSLSRIASLGGTEKDLQVPPRRRWPASSEQS